MIQVKLTTVTGESKTIPFYSKQAVDKFIGFFPTQLTEGLLYVLTHPL
jgi:hypothetical protein